MLLYLHHINFKIFFHPAKFDNFKDEKISDYKSVSVAQSKTLLDLKLGSLTNHELLLRTFFFCCKNIVVSALKIASNRKKHITLNLKQELLPAKWSKTNTSMFWFGVRAININKYFLVLLPNKVQFSLHSSRIVLTRYCLQTFTSQLSGFNRKY